MANLASVRQHERFGNTPPLRLVRQPFLRDGTGPFKPVTRVRIPSGTFASRRRDWRLRSPPVLAAEEVVPAQAPVRGRRASACRVTAADQLPVEVLDTLRSPIPGSSPR